MYKKIILFMLLLSSLMSESVRLIEKPSASDNKQNGLRSKLELPNDSNPGLVRNLKKKEPKSVKEKISVEDVSNRFDEHTGFLDNTRSLRRIEFIEVTDLCYEAFIKIDKKISLPETEGPIFEKFSELFPEFEDFCKTSPRVDWFGRIERKDLEG